MILVTGGTGFIGSHLLDKLSALGEPARCLLRRKPRPRRLPAGIEAVYGDLTSGEGVEEAINGADTVIHLAGVTKALTTRDYYAGNVRTTETLLRALAGRSEGAEASQYLQQAVDAYRSALQVYTESAFPARWSKTTRNLANAYETKTDWADAYKCYELLLSHDPSNLDLQVKVKELSEKR